MAKSLKQIEGQAKRLENELRDKINRMGGALDDAFRARMRQLNGRISLVRTIEARYVTNLVQQDKAVYEAFAQQRTGDWGADQRLAEALGVGVAENKPYPREVYMA